MKTTLSERLKKARSDAGMTQKALGDAIGVSQAAIQKIETGKASQTTKIVEIAGALSVNPEWLSSGNGPMRNDGKGPPITNSNDNFRIDVLDLTVSAGPGIINREFVEVLRSVEYSHAEARHMFDGRKADNIRIINVRGDSMSGTIEPGDLLFVDISVKSFDGDGIYAFLYDETAHVKRLQMMKDKLLVISDNKTYVPWDAIENEEMNRLFIFGKVIGSMPQTYRKHG
ncbi:XRE family transcriptional regulator [Pluralibacter gergoviae]|uniref:XRE family transcriptional regulator n=1 Tax=Pluralibacter gergoviae TaxID=61647 RepID=UPI001FF62BA4|nr:helix-turn-helix transcriptional regulator [Pluralibacter gergoviae]MCK1065041.1 helix-turn-helix transcriptional regulator [Pluralibacter gergoviae]